MLQSALLIDGTAVGIILIVAVCAIALAAFLYGFFRKFIRVSWMAWQVLLIWALTLLLRFLPADLTAGVKFGLGAGLLFGVTAAVLLTGGIVRRAMLRRMRPAPLFFRIFNRIVGGLTAVLAAALLLAATAGLVLVFCYVCIEPPAALGALYALPVWTDFLSSAIVDFVLVGIVAVSMQCGYRVGFGRSLFVILMLLLTLGAVFFSLFLVFRVGFLNAFARNLVSAENLNGLVADVIGIAIVAFVIFCVLFVLICLLGIPLNALVRKAASVKVLGFLDGALMSVVFFLVVFALIVAFDTGVAWLAGASFSESASFLGPVGGFAARLSAFVCSSPLSALLYGNNPLLLLLGL